MKQSMDKCQPPFWGCGHERMSRCACGRNASCLDCDFGYGAAPCECDKDRVPIHVIERTTSQEQDDG